MRLIPSVRRLVESESEDVQVFAVDAFAKLAEMEVVLLEALGREAVDERNPLAEGEAMSPEKRYELLLLIRLSWGEGYAATSSPTARSGGWDGGWRRGKRTTRRVRSSSR